MKALLLPALLAFWAAPAASAGFCDGSAAGIIYASCASAAPSAAVMLLPEDAGPTPEGALDVTAAYTAPDRRDKGLPKPAGLFVRGGEIISREYVRFDGVLTIERGAPLLHYRRRVHFGGRVYDLEDAGARSAFLTAAAARGASVLQSHLLIIDGAVDTAPVANAPAFRRRILMQDAAGDFAIYDSSPRSLTLHQAAEEVAARFAPVMALNLDMGSYDFCRRGAALCGTLPVAQTGKLSNLLRLR